MRRSCRKRTADGPDAVHADLTDGERWAREQLGALMARRFTPAACVRFLRDSWRRSGAIQHERPELARRAHCWGAIGAAGWLALAAAGAEPFRRRLRSGIAWWAVTAAMLDWHLGMVETADGRVRNLGAGDALTLARAWLVPVALDGPTPFVCGLAAATDALDGPLARRAGATRAGRDLEGLVDACFTAAALRGAMRRGWLPPAVAAAELLRLGVGLGYGLATYFGGARPPRPELLRAARATTAIRAGGLALAGTPRRRAGAAVLAIGSLTSVALSGTAARAPRANLYAMPTRGQHPSKAAANTGMAQESDLVRRAQDGDRGAFEQLVHLHADRLHAVVLRISGDRHDAEEIVQEAFLRAWRGIGRFHGHSQFFTWLYRIGVNEAKRYHERRSALSTDARLDDAPRDLPDERQAPHVRAEVHDLRRALEEAILALPIDYRMPLVLRDVEGLSTADASAVMELSEAAFKSRLHRARLAVRAAVEDLVAQEDDR